ncbi:type II secretion system protein [bacterium]|nr:type II secretion system protein [bacterium]
MRKGFTLAEVLITLGVIGVVASITLPTLIKEYNKHAWVNSLKQNYSLLNQGFKKMMADDGVEFIADTEVWRAIGDNGCYSGDDISSDKCKDFYAQLKKYFRIVRIGFGSGAIGSHGQVISNSYKYRNYNSEEFYFNNIIHLSNGAMIWGHYFYKNPPSVYSCDAVLSKGGHMCSEAGYFNIDINGNKGPNEFGKDIFMFYITERGQLAPAGGNDYALFYAVRCGGGKDLYKTRMGLNGECIYGTSGGESNSGACYSGLLIDQLNWKMDY